MVLCASEGLAETRLRSEVNGHGGAVRARTSTGETLKVYGRGKVEARWRQGWQLDRGGHVRTEGLMYGGGDPHGYLVGLRVKRCFAQAFHAECVLRFKFVLMTCSRRSAFFVGR